MVESWLSTGEARDCEAIARACWGEWIRTTDYLIQSQVSEISDSLTSSGANSRKREERGRFKRKNRKNQVSFPEKVNPRACANNVEPNPLVACSSRWVESGPRAAPERHPRGQPLRLQRSSRSRREIARGDRARFLGVGPERIQRPAGQCRPNAVFPLLADLQRDAYDSTHAVRSADHFETDLLLRNRGQSRHLSIGKRWIVKSWKSSSPRVMTACCVG
jgi:hypothetical protein